MGALGKSVESILSTRSLGIRVARAAAVDVPNTVWTNIFSIAGGLVLVTSLIGVRTVVQAGGASNMQFRHSVGATVLCAATAVAANAVGTIYTITGNFADAITLGAAGVPILGGIAGGLLATGNQGYGILMGVGNIQVSFSAAGHTGSTRYVLTYIQVDDGASVGVA